MDTTYAILKKIGHEEFDGWAVDNAVLRYERFLTILMTPASGDVQYNSSRTVREKWKMLFMLGFFQRVNQSDVARVDVHKVKSYINLYGVE